MLDDVTNAAEFLLDYITGAHVDADEKSGHVTLDFSDSEAARLFVRHLKAQLPGVDRE